ncbi:MAG: prephenate dehydrogenase/arogenate dehydrogenase family protein [Lachnospiraceae bacterium]|nr:prephenate dehydrogenase/arogenate dehydrogenase family protein [Lachnospiraceae bacterium]
MHEVYDNLNCLFIGFGLIGGSIAKSLKRIAPKIRLSVFDPDQESLLQAQKDGICDAIVGNINAGIPAYDIVFLCAPVLENEKNLQNLLFSCNYDGIITDVGSVKGKIVSIAQTVGFSKCFIGGHPMAGKERFGYKSASDSLFQDAYYLLTPASDVPDEKISFMEGLLSAIGAHPMVISPDHHDVLVSAISHLPHLAAYSLVNLVKDADEKDGLMKLLAAGGFKDITRVASSSPDMWEQICMDNLPNIEDMLDRYIMILQEVQTLLKDKNGPALHAFFEKAKTYRDSF